jgi:hypothetical protein
MKLLIAMVAVASILVTPAGAKTKKARPERAQPNNSVTCGRIVFTDPDPSIRAQFLRDCAR